MKVIFEQENSDGIRYADTGITKDEWLEMLTDGIINQRQLEVLLCFYREPEHQGVCNVLAKKYGGNANNFNTPIWQLGRSVQNYLNRFEIRGLDNNGKNTDDKVFWCITMTGKDSKQGYVWSVRPELCEALEVYLYRNLVNVYRNRRKTTDLVGDDELYKWEYANECVDKSNLEIVRLSLPNRINLLGWREKDQLRTMLKKQPEELDLLLKSLYDEEIEFSERVKSFIQGVATLKHNVDERAASVLLGAKMPNKYLFYKDSYYKDLCAYLGIKCAVAGDKYQHYTQIMRPIIDLVSHDKELNGYLEKNIGSLLHSDLITAQEVVYTIFERELINPKKITDIFDWIPFYTELATKLLEYKDSPSELATAIYSNFDKEKEIKFLHDGDGSDFKEIDPFTVFSIINRTMKNRVEMIKKMKTIFEVKTKVPTSFEGLPTQNPMNAAFCCFTENRTPDGKDIERLWNLFELAQEESADMEDVFNAVLKQTSIAVPKLTMGLFYIRPYKFLSLDSNNVQYLEQYGISMKDFRKMKYAEYTDLLTQIKEKMKNKEIVEQSYPEFSANAYSGVSSEEDGTDNEYYKELVELLRYKKNIIIEGAPGVGKTYELPRIITRLCFPELANAPQSVLRIKFNELKDSHRVEYVTFHQSMDYEEFVEGIRPKSDNDGNISYEVVPGLFKQICDAAKQPIVEDNNFQINSGAAVWKVSLAGTGDNPVRSDCMKNGHIRIGWDKYGEDLSNVPGSQYEGRVVLNTFYDKMQIGDIVFSCYSSRTIDAIGVVTSDPEWHDEYKDYKRVRKVEWLVKGINEDIYDINNQTAMVLATVYRLNYITLENVLDLLNKYGVNEPAEARKNTRPYVLVIDEINRGNVSKIFGELITLIEPDKRLGRESETEVELPYSKTRFSVPDNLYIIGTMNTADRSLDTLDYAMRRRFAFVKYKPIVLEVEGFNSELFAKVSKLFIENFDEYCDNPDAILRPSSCLSDDIQPTDVWIGHSYFLMDDNGVDRTKLRIQYEIVPILEEYIKDGVFKDAEPVKEVISELIEYTTEETDD